MYVLSSIYEYYKWVADTGVDVTKCRFSRTKSNKKAFISYFQTLSVSYMMLVKY